MDPTKEAQYFGVLFVSLGPHVSFNSGDIITKMSCMKLRCIRNNNTLSNYLISIQYPSLHNAHSLILFSLCDCHVPFKSLEVIRNVEFNYVRGSSWHRCWYQQQRKMSYFLAWSACFLYVIPAFLLQAITYLKSPPLSHSHNVIL